MRLSLKAMTIVACVMISVCAKAETPTEDLTQRLLSIKTMQADFTQNVSDKSARSLQRAVGHLALQRPGKFRWEVKQPPQVIIANDTKLWIYDPDLEQVTIKPFSKSTEQTPAFLLSDANLNVDHDFTVEIANEPSQIANLKTFNLTPKQKDSMFSLIKLTFLNAQIHEMQLHDHLGHVTTIAFQHIKTGMTLPASLFTFTPTAKIDVIDETQKR